MKEQTLAEINNHDFRNGVFEFFDDNMNQLYFEDSSGYWEKRKYDKNGKEIYFEDSDGYKNFFKGDNMILSEINPEKRICEIYKSNWRKIEFSDLKYGNIFRLFDFNTKFPLEDKTGNYQFVAQSNARKSDGIFFIDCIPLTPII